MIPTFAVLIVTVMTVALGSFGLRFARTTSNFFVASRSVHPVWNAFAVSGEAMSAASYLGLPALLMVFGVDLMWALVGWTLGFLMLSLFVAAPMRRSGAYTIPEFIENRLDSPALRPIVAIVVIVVTWFFLLAQLKGAGVVVRELIGTPYWVGVVMVGVLVAANLSAGGMRGITFVQGFQFFFIFLGILVPFVVVSTLWFQDRTEPIIVETLPAFSQDTGATYSIGVTIEVVEPVTAAVEGTVDGVAASRAFEFEPGSYAIGADTDITWPADSLVPFAEDIEPLDGSSWSLPFGDKDLAGGHTRYFAFATVIAHAFGIMGMPHIVVRFYTNPTGHEARRTSVWFLLMIVPYYTMLPMLGAHARVAAPELFSTGAVDSATVSIGNLVDGAGREWVTAAVSAGAAAAFLSTASGLLIAMAGAFSHDIRAAGVPEFRRAIWIGAAISIVTGLLVESVNISSLIGWSSAIAGASLAPVILLGIWWPGLTRTGAIATLAVGGGAATIASIIGLAGLVGDGWAGALLGQPALWAIPLAFVTGIGVSLRDRQKVADLGHKFALMHLPDRVEPMVAT